MENLTLNRTAAVICIFFLFFSCSRYHVCVQQFHQFDVICCEYEHRHMSYDKSFIARILWISVLITKWIYVS